MLCESCQSMLCSHDRAKPPVGSGNHHHTLKDLQGAASSYCGICMILAEHPNLDKIAVKDGEPFTRYEYDMYRGESLFPSQWPILRLQFPRSSSGNSREFMLVDMDNSTDSESLQDAWSEEVDSRSLGDDVVMNMASCWLETCCKEHRSCFNSESLNSLRKEYPKRLLEIQDNKIRLIESNVETPTKPYATLSHCWGPNPTFHTLTSENMSEMKTEIHLSVLPPTFKDAIQVCRSLNIVYLWIDSLCIIQSGEGSVEDWLEHAEAMRQIYAHGLLNISANRAYCADDGFLLPRDPERIKPIIVSHPNSPDVKYQVVDLQLAQRHIAESPIAKRAWVLQERLLATRVLHFTSQQLFWECREQPLACETYPSGVPCFSDQSKLTMAPFNIDSILSRSRIGWYQILEDYTACKLTKPEKDKFVALAGIVEIIQQESSEEYIAGMFRSDLPVSLLWFVPPNIEQPAQNQSTGKYRAPSWSWASQDDPVSFELAKELQLSTGSAGNSWFKYSAQLLEAISVPVDTWLPTGRVREASVTIRGCIARVHWQIKDRIEHLVEGVQIRFLCSSNMTNSVELTVFGVLDRPDSYLENPTGAVALLLAQPPPSFALFFSAGLIVVPELGSDRRRYRRVGCWWTNELEAAQTLQRLEEEDIVLV